jgi:hypothetical protein
MARIDSQSGIRIDQVTTKRIDSNTDDDLGLITKAQTTLGSVTRNQTALPSHVTKQVSPATQITA